MVLGVLYKAKEILKAKKSIKVADIITDYIQIFRPDDFILKKRFRIAKSLQMTLGKWPSMYGNAVFFDSNYVLEDLIHMVSSNLITALKRNEMDEKQVGVVKFLTQAALRRTKYVSINDYAIFVMVHLKDRKNLYTKNKHMFSQAVQGITSKLAGHLHFSVKKPIQEQIEQMSIITYFLDNLLFTVIFFLCMVSFILIFSLIQSVSLLNL